MYRDDILSRSILLSLSTCHHILTYMVIIRAEVEDIYDGFVHLTNVAIQKAAENYDERTGGKMDLQSLKLFLVSRYGVDRIDSLFHKIQMIILKSLIAVQHIMMNDRHCFELYGEYVSYLF